MNHPAASYLLALAAFAGVGFAAGHDPPRAPPTTREASAAGREVQRSSTGRVDAACLRRERTRHQQAIALCRAKLESGQGDPDLAAFARATLPILEQQLDTVDGLLQP